MYISTRTIFVFTILHTFWISMRPGMCGEIIPIAFMPIYDKKRARGLLGAMSATLQGQWGYTTMAGGVLWLNGRKRLRTIAWCHLVTAEGTRFARFLAEPSVTALIQQVHIFMHISHIVYLNAYFRYQNTYITYNLFVWILYQNTYITD